MSRETAAECTVWHVNPWLNAQALSTAVTRLCACGRGFRRCNFSFLKPTKSCGDMCNVWLNLQYKSLISNFPYSAKNFEYRSIITCLLFVLCAFVTLVKYLLTYLAKIRMIMDESSVSCLSCFHDSQRSIIAKLICFVSIRRLRFLITVKHFWISTAEHIIRYRCIFGSMVRRLTSGNGLVDVLVRSQMFQRCIILGGTIAAHS